MTPLSYLAGAGARAHPVVALTWGLLVLSIAVCLIIGALVVAGVWRARRASAWEELPTTPVVAPQPRALRWLTIGVGTSFVFLVAALFWTVGVLAAVGPTPKSRLTIEVTGQQWWWRVRYPDPDPTRVFSTANEIHIPVGQPVRVILRGGDVIHSFWVPALSGKTDTIPGQVNETWLEAERPGTFLGACTEYCGLQHAHMGLSVVAQAPAEFAAWRAGQAQPAAPPAGPDQSAGAQLFLARCGNCHAIKGSEAGGVAGPDLTHLMSRGSLAAGTLPNTTAGLLGWIGNPQGVKPGTLMPATLLSGPELASLRAYLETLR